MSKIRKGSWMLRHVICRDWQPREPPKLAFARDFALYYLFPITSSLLPKKAPFRVLFYIVIYI